MRKKLISQRCLFGRSIEQLLALVQLLAICRLVRCQSNFRRSTSRIFRMVNLVADMIPPQKTVFEVSSTGC
jgi:uncharacterized protein (DUF1499 family)